MQTGGLSVSLWEWESSVERERERDAATGHSGILSNTCKVRKSQLATQKEAGRQRAGKKKHSTELWCITIRSWFSLPVPCFRRSFCCYVTTSSDLFFLYGLVCVCVPNQVIHADRLTHTHKKKHTEREREAAARQQIKALPSVWWRGKGGEAYRKREGLC